MAEDEHDQTDRGDTVNQHHDLHQFAGLAELREQQDQAGYTQCRAGQSQ